MAATIGPKLASANEPLRGYVYVQDGDQGPMLRAEPGAIVKAAAPGPPCIPVSHVIEDVIVARWPGRLWRVELLKRAKAQPVESASYTRAVAVKTLEARPWPSSSAHMAARSAR